MKRNYLNIKGAGLLLLVLLTLSLYSCSGARKGRCAECPEFTKTWPLQHSATEYNYKPC